MSDLEIIKEYYGFNTKDAKYYMKSVSYKTIEAIKKDYKKQCEKAFYND